MPLVQADANSGVIISDWNANPAAPTERVKVTISILDKDLRADALPVAASRKGYSTGQWLDAELRARTVQRPAQVILATARALRRAPLGSHHHTHTVQTTSPLPTQPTH